MKNLIITKWIEPYRLLETIKQYYDYKDFTFDGLNKQIKKSAFIKEFSNCENAIGLYMKNVNKFYLFNRSSSFDIISKLTEVFGFVQGDYEEITDTEQSFNLIDLGKAEAAIILN